LPIEEQNRIWIEKAFQWLLDQFGTEYFLKRKTILPESSFFPNNYQRTEDDVVKIVDCVCAYMDVDPKTIVVEFFIDRDDTAQKHRTGNPDEYSGAAGLYFREATPDARRKIAINVTEFQNPMRMVATIAHELGHVILLGGGRLSPEHKSHEHVTDLITVFYGLGIFAANSAFQFSQWQDSSHHGWSASRSGYLPEEAFAYSLALYAWLRGEANPEWANYLSMNVGYYFKDCLKYLNRGGQTSLRRLVSERI